MNELVSVVLPVYNGALYIEEALDSILEQTYSNIECIVIDDGSTDETLDILLKYKKKDQRLVIITRENRGLVESLNEGICISKGKYIARMDSDDISHKERFEKQVEYLEENEDVYILGTNYTLIYEEGVNEDIKKGAEGTNKRSRASIDKENWFLSTNETMKFIHPTIMIRKELFDKVGLYRQYKLEDLELYFRAGINNLRIDKLEEDLLKYRVRAQSKSRTEARREQTKEIIEIKTKYLAENHLKNSTKLNYMIWGADISGEEAVSIIKKYFPCAMMEGYIDSFKDGIFNGYKMIKPDKIKEYDLDYIFICSNGGAVFARQYLKDIGMSEIEDFFKVS